MHRSERKGTPRKRGYDHRVGTRGLRKKWRRGEGAIRKGRGSDTRTADGSGQELEEGKEAWSSSTANQAGIGGCQDCSRFTTA